MGCQVSKLIRNTRAPLCSHSPQSSLFHLGYHQQNRTNMSISNKQRKYSLSNQHSCRQISTHITLDRQVQCLTTKVSKLSLSLTGGKTLHPSQVLLDSNNVKLRPCLVNRLSAVTIAEKGDMPVQRRKKQGPVSTGDIVGTSRQSTLNNKRYSAQLATDKTKKQLTIDNQLCANITSFIQLLHPDWRKIPWKHYFGWTDAHRDLCKQLQCQVMRGCLESIYYQSAKEHCAAGMTWRYHHSDSPFLGGPVVNTVCEALELIRRVHRCDVTSHQPTDVAGPGYDGDVEDDV